MRHSEELVLKPLKSTVAVFSRYSAWSSAYRVKFLSHQTRESLPRAVSVPKCTLMNYPVSCRIAYLRPHHEMLLWKILHMKTGHHGLFFLLTCSANCGTFYAQVFAFPMLTECPIYSVLPQLDSTTLLLYYYFCRNV